MTRNTQRGLTGLLRILLSLFVLAQAGVMLGPAAASASCRVSGVVADEAGVAQGGVTVVLEPEGLAVETDDEGRYCFPQARAGRVRIVAEGDGRGRGVSPAMALAIDAPIAVDLVLDPLLREDVVVTATRTPRRLAETPVRVEIVDREVIEQSASRTLADAVERTPGVRVENDCQNCNFSQVRLLGLEGAYSQILFDGQPTMSSLAAVYGIEHIPARFIERLEIVKGGGSALYGPGSVAGVINVIPRDPDRTGGTVAVRQSGFEGDGFGDNSLNAVLDYITGDKNTIVTVFGQRDRVDAYDRTGDGFSELGYRDLDAVGARVVRYFDERDGRLTFDVSNVHEDRRGGDNLDRPVTESEVAEAVESDRTLFSVALDRRHGNGFDYQLTASAALTKRDTYYGSGGDPNAFGESDNPLYILDAQFNHRKGGHILTWGAQFQQDNLEDRQPAYDRRIEETYENVGAYAQSDWTISRKVTLVTGVRADKFSELDSAIISPRAAIRYSPRTDVRFRASLATGFRGPQVFDEDLHITQVGGEGAVIRNDAGLTEESSLSVMAGVEWLPLVGKRPARFEVNAFHTTIDDIFQIQDTDDPDTTNQFEFTRVNAGSASVYGVEVNASTSLGRLFDVDAGFVLQRARYDEAEPDFGSRDIFRTPERYGNLSLVYENDAVVDVVLSAIYTGPMFVPHYAGFIPEDRLETTDAFLTFDITFSRRINLSRDGSGLEIALGVKNITDDYQDDLDDGPDRDAGYVYGPRTPREIHLGLRFDF